jgi:hypothetical protein
MRTLPSCVSIGEESSVHLGQFYVHYVLGALLFSVVRSSEFVPDFSAYVSSGGIWLFRVVRYD